MFVRPGSERGGREVFRASGLGLPLLGLKVSSLGV